MHPETEPPQIAPPATRSHGWLAWSIAFLLTVLNLLLGFALVAHRGPDRWGELVGGTVAPILLGLLVVVMTRPFARARPRLSHLRVYNWALTFVLLSSVVQLAQRIAPQAT